MVDENDIIGSDADPAGDLLALRPVVSPTTCLIAYRLPVHRFRDEDPSASPLRAPVYLVATRRRDDGVAFIENTGCLNGCAGVERDRPLRHAR